MKAMTSFKSGITGAGNFRQFQIRGMTLSSSSGFVSTPWFNPIKINSIKDCKSSISRLFDVNDVFVNIGIG